MLKWLIFYDIDEFIFLKNYNNIKDFLNEPKFNKCKIINLNWVHHTDNNLIHYENKSVIERFPKKFYNESQDQMNELVDFKSIIRGHMRNIKINCVHRLVLKFEGCDAYGRKYLMRNIKKFNPDNKKYYINHYFCKSLKEFTLKVKRGSPNYGINDKNKLYKINKYFLYNKITKEKIDYIEKETKLNLTEYRNKIKNYKLKK